NIVGGTGVVRATSTVNGNAKAEIIIGDQAVLAGQNIQLNANAPMVQNTSNVSVEAEAKANTVVYWVMEKVNTFNQAFANLLGKIPLIGKFLKKAYLAVTHWIEKLVAKVLHSDSVATPVNNMSNSGRVLLNGEVHLGGGSAGIYVDVKEDGTVVSSGLDDQYATEIGELSTKSALAITLHKIWNNDVGSLTANTSIGDVTGSIRVFNSSFLPRIVINNYSKLNLILSEILAINGDQPRPSIYAGNVQVASYNYEVPTLVINAADVDDKMTTDQKEVTHITVGNTIDFGDGDINITMNGGNLEAANSSSIRANRLTILGANQIGSQETPLRAYMHDIDAQDYKEFVDQPKRPVSLFIKTLGDIWLAITPIIVPSKGKDYVGTPQLTLKNVTSETGKTNIDIAAPEQISGIEEGSKDDDVEISTPGRNDNYVSAPWYGRATNDYEILDKYGNKTGYFMTAEGKLRTTSGFAINLKDYLVVKRDVYNDIYYNYYYIPTGEMVLTDEYGKVVTVYQVNSDKPTSGYNFDNIAFTIDKNSNRLTAITILLPGIVKDTIRDLTDPQYYSQRVEFALDGNVTLLIGGSGGTVKIDPSKD
ncbi:MAG: hypothetical protein RR361_05840, partial [Anaerovorax sp.]